MGKIDLFVVGASAGGLEALEKVVSRLPGDFPAAICIVMHVAPDSPGLVPELLSSMGPLPARHARHGEALASGRIFVAPPDRHLLVDVGRRLWLGRGPKENRFRPAVDPLFRSATLALDGNVAGVILSGGLDDGVAGLADIKAGGGAAIVQDPSDALAPSMPRAALRAVDADHRAPAHEIAAIMSKLARAYAPAPSIREAHMSEHLDKEVRIAAGRESHMVDVAQMGAPSLFTCPDCHGALIEIKDASPPRFRCHTGHAYTLESLAEAADTRVEENLWSAIRSLEESASLNDELVRELTGADEPRRSKAVAAAEQARRLAALVRAAVKQDMPSHEKAP
jgi:two-component system chemotaxis response regulator CheB